MKYFLVLQENERQTLRILPPGLKKKIRNGLDEILSDPLCGKALIEELAGFRSYKVGAVRMVYKIEKNAIHLIAIGPRKNIYQRAISELRRKEE